MPGAVDAKRPERQFELVEYIGRLNEINKVLYNRELAYFYADHDIKPKEGLELALRELDYRRDVYAYDVVAWNLYRNGKFAEARTAIDQALRLGTQDAKLFFHAGMIYESLGEKTKAKEFSFSSSRAKSVFSSLVRSNSRRKLCTKSNWILIVRP
jgi:tetratricopeptide (TPR) repeat protein